MWEKKRGLAIVAIVLVGAALAGHAQSEPTLDDCAIVGASAAVGLAETYVEGLIRTMVVLAATAPVQAGSWDGMVDLLATFEGTSLPMATWFLLPDGSYYTVDGGRAAANLSDRDYFPGLMSGQIVAGSVVVSRSTGRLSAVAAVPVTTGGQVIGALGVSLFLETLSAAIAEDLSLPDGVLFYAVVEDGKIALHSNPQLLGSDVSAVGVIEEDTATVVSGLLGWTFGVGPAQ